LEGAAGYALHVSTQLRLERRQRCARFEEIERLERDPPEIEHHPRCGDHRRETVQGDAWYGSAQALQPVLLLPLT